MAGNSGPTIADLINEALGILGVYSGENPLSAADQQSAFFTFQALVDGWGAEPLTFRQTTVTQFSTTAGKQSYVIGPAQQGVTIDWTTSFLPLEFPQGSLQMVTGTLELPISIDTDLEWEAIAIKSMQSGILTDCWPQLGLTTHTLNFWPLPNATIPVNLYLPQQFAKPTAVTAALVAPPGYQEALSYELAIKCASKFGAAIPAWLPEAWTDAKFKLKAMNFEPLDAVCDQALLAKGRRTGGGSVKFYTGE